jgi:hypothetical protein
VGKNGKFFGGKEYKKSEKKYKDFQWKTSGQKMGTFAVEKKWGKMAIHFSLRPPICFGLFLFV